MATFSPPTDNFVTWAGPYDTGILAHLTSGPRGRNVFKLGTGIYSENQPANVGEAEKTYYGGHIYELTAEEEIELTRAGYGDFITA